MNEILIHFFSLFAANNVFHHYSENGFETKTSSASSNSTVNCDRSDSSDSETENRDKNSPILARRSINRSKPQNQSTERLIVSNATTNETNDANDDLAYVDTLPEEVKLVEVTSNLWGTKFKIHGLAKTVPANLGQVTYKTSFLHLQPRQMTLVITELRDDFPMEPDPNFNPNIFSEDEDEHAQSIANNQRRTNSSEGAPLIAPMSPRPNRFTSRSKNSHLIKNDKKNQLGPLAKAEMYEDDLPQNEQNAENSTAKPIRPKHIETSITSTSRPGPSYSSFVAQYSRSTSNGSGQSRHAISPLCCEGSVPTLQSPKNAVGPSDTIFERPPAVQTTALINYPNNNDYTNTMLHTKNTIAIEQQKSNAQQNLNQPILNVLCGNRDNSKNLKEKTTKKKDIQYIDEDAPSSSTVSTAPIADESCMRRTPTIVSISPACMSASMTRSCSVGYLDSVEMVPSDVALSILRKETPNKRLVLVDRKPNKKCKQTETQPKKMKLVQCGKSKSLDSCDLNEIPLKMNCTEPANMMPKLSETNETEHSTTVIAEVTDSPSHMKRAQRKFLETSIMNSLPCVTSSEQQQQCSYCRCSIRSKQQNCENCKKTSTSISADQTNKTVSNITTSKTTSNSSYVENSTAKISSKLDQIFSEPPIKASSSKATKPPAIDRKGKPRKKNTEVITSYTDSPLFSRKHRFGDDANSSRYSNSDTRSSPLLCRKFETGISLLKQFSEARKRRKEENLQLIKTDSQNDLQQVPATETKASVALHTQALTTLENIISRLRDLDESRLTPPSSPQHNRYPRSSPASPALSKKGKRNPSTSPIRQLLNSPLLNRRNRKKQQAESSDDESTANNNINDESSGKYNYRDLETFQKAQLRQKVCITLLHSLNSFVIDSFYITIYHYYHYYEKLSFFSLCLDSISFVFLQIAVKTR